MTDASNPLGPVSYLIVEFPGNKMTGDGLPLLVDLVDRGIIRILDLLFVMRGEDGTIRGVFSNGVSRDLGQVRMARFTNPVGLEQVGNNNFAQGVNSGLPIEGNPGENGIGSIVAGAVELSNTDIGKNLIDLITATTQYRGNARVITAVQQLLGRDHPPLRG